VTGDSKASVGLKSNEWTLKRKGGSYNQVKRVYSPASVMVVEAKTWERGRDERKKNGQNPSVSVTWATRLI